jgi:hypothetical protein
MNRLHAGAASAVVASSLALALSVFAAKPAAKPGAAPAAAADAPIVQTVGTLLEGFKWGVNHNDVIKVYNATDTGRFDQEYNPILAKMQPGVRMQALEADRENRKAAFAATFTEFKDTPTGYDATGLKGEYSYKNHEAIMNVDKDGKRRYFFFFGSPPGERFWKFYDEIALKDGGPLGKTYQEAVTKLNVAMGVAGRIRAADPTQGVMYTTTDWQDGTTHVRAVDRSFEHLVGVALEEGQTYRSLSQLRANKEEDPLAMDPSISAITRGGVSDPSGKRAGADAGTPPKKK